MESLNQPVGAVLALRGDDDLRRRRRICDAFVAIVSCLTKRPEPSWPWDDAARPVAMNTTRLKFLTRDVDYIRLALQQAVREGRMTAHQCDDAARAFFQEKYEASVSGIVRAEIDPKYLLPEATTDTIKEASEAIAAIVEVREQPSEARWIRARREIGEAIEKLCKYRLFGHAVHEGGRRPAA